MIFVCALLKVEYQSALARRTRDGCLSLAEAATTERALGALYRRYIQRAVDEPVLDEAAALTKRRRLRTLDAIQLAAARSIQSFLDDGDRLLFIASDQRLLAAAQAEGLPSWNPESGPPPVSS